MPCSRASRAAPHQSSSLPPQGESVIKVAKKAIFIFVCPAWNSWSLASFLCGCSAPTWTAVVLTIFCEFGPSGVQPVTREAAMRSR